MSMNDTAYCLSGKSFTDPVSVIAKLWEQKGKWKPDTYLALLHPIILLALTPPKVILVQPCQLSSDRDYVCPDGKFLMCNVESQ